MKKMSIRRTMSRHVSLDLSDMKVQRKGQHQSTSRIVVSNVSDACAKAVVDFRQEHSDDDDVVYITISLEDGLFSEMDKEGSILQENDVFIKLRAREHGSGEIETLSALLRCIADEIDEHYFEDICLRCGGESL